jgi:hypothetical protein
MLSSRRSTTLLGLSTVLCLAFFVNAPVRAQITGTYTYDADNHAYFVTGDTTIDGDISSNVVLIGKDNATDFNTVADHITVRVVTGAVTTNYSFRYPVGDPNGREYGGLAAFGGNTIEVTGGSSWYTWGYDTSTVNVSGGTTGVWAHDASTANIMAGSVSAAYSSENGTVNIYGGDIGPISSFNNSTINFSGGTATLDSYCYDTSTINLSGGTADVIHGYDTSMVNITGGTLGFAYGLGSNITNISGGTVKNIYDFGSNTTNISGGNVGGIESPPNESGNFDPNEVGIYLKSGTLNLYGSAFSLSGAFAGIYANTAGTYSTLTGTLLDGTALNTTLFLANGVTYEDLGGGTQKNAILPDVNGDGMYTFHGVPSGAWFDPPMVGTYQFTMTDGNFFTNILAFPTNIGDADGKFAVSVGNTLIGVFGEGESVSFADFGFANGVTAFTISGISPLVDGANPLGFPVKLAFSSPFTSFTMEGITITAPEPGTLTLILVGLAGCAVRRNRRKLLPI